MKRLVSLLLAGVMAVSLVACGTSSSSSSSEPAQTGGTELEEHGSSEQETGSEVDPSSVKVGMITDTGGIHDNSFNQSSWAGLQRAEEELGITVSYLESKTDADYSTNIEAFVDEGYDLIICVGFMLANATREAAETYPDQKFAILDDSSCSDLDNVACLMFEQAQASYLVGVVAGMMTESNTCGFVIGNNTEVMNQFGYGYIAGILDTNEEAKVLQYNANAFGDTAVGKTAAVDMITKGADVIFHAAGGTGSGVIEACKENNIWAIGVDSDQSYLAPENVITSAMKRVDNASYQVSQSVLNGTFEGGIQVFSLEDGGVDIAPTDTLLPDEVKTAVQEVKEKILSGEIVVPEDKESFEAKYGDIYELD